MIVFNYLNDEDSNWNLYRPDNSFQSLWGPQVQVTRMPSQNWAKIKLVWDLTPVLIICKFDEDLIKNEVAIVRTTFYPLYVYVRLKGK